jgi:hypothetical protein
MQELVRTQQVLNKKHLGFAALRNPFSGRKALGSGADEFRPHALEV